MLSAEENHWEKKLFTALSPLLQLFVLSEKAAKVVVEATKKCVKKFQKTYKNCIQFFSPSRWV